LTSLSFRGSNAITASGMSHLSELVNLTSLDLERCPRIHGGLLHIKSMSDLPSRPSPVAAPLLDVLDEGPSHFECLPQCCFLVFPLMGFSRLV
jgi:hypothetical protein